MSPLCLLCVLLLGAAPASAQTEDAANAVATPAPQNENAASPADATEESGVKVDVVLPRTITDEWKRFSELPLWDDGLSEMSYYDATCKIYDKLRKYTRVHLMNRQFMAPKFWVKAIENTEDPTHVFKFVIAEEIPTENYNYRFLITAFLERPSLEPFKVSVSSQEWCGHTYKYLLWTRFREIDPADWPLDIVSHSYFGMEGDRWFPKPAGANIDAFECLFVFARAVVASGGQSREMHLLRSMHTNRAVDPEPLDAILQAEGKPRTITVPLGKFKAQLVVLDWLGEPTWFDVETAPPYRLLRFRADDVEGELRFVERRAYWDRDSSSAFHKPGQAP